MKIDKKNLIGFIDIASAKISVMICSLDENKKPIFLAKGESKTKGFKNGRIINYDDFSSSINEALDIAERRVKRKFNVVVNVVDVVISLSDFKYNYYTLSAEKEFAFEKSISVKDVQNCIRTLPIQSVIDLDKEVLVHVVPKKFIVDGNKIIENPEGYYSQFLKIECYIITVDVDMYSDLVDGLKQINLNVKQAVANSYASALSTLVDDEKKLGTLVMDIGKSTTSLAIFSEDVLVYSCSIPVGGERITNMISKKINVKYQEAERLKVKYGVNKLSPFEMSEYINVKMIGENGEDEEQEILKSDYFNVAYTFVRAIVNIIKQGLVNENVSKLFSKIVLTGNGAKLLGINEVVSEVFDCPVRIAKPVKIKELSDNFDDVGYSTLIGMFIFHYFKSSGLLYYENHIDENENKNLLTKFIDFWNKNFG